jgi:hypothetical protein
MKIIFNPRWQANKLARVGRDISFAWLTLNHVKLPDRIYFDRVSAGDLLEPDWYGAQEIDTSGFSRIAVAVSECPRGMKAKEGTVIHSPGSFEDYTPLGILCHEIGHYYDQSRNKWDYSVSNGFKRVIGDEAEISNSEYNDRESFAEAIRLFITNPNLLEIGRPARWEYLRSNLKLKPLHNTNWKTVLSKAHKRARLVTDKWVSES